VTPSNLIFRLLVLLVVLSPLPLGSNRPLAWSMLSAGVGSLLALWTWYQATGRAAAALPWQVFRPGLFLLLPVLLWCLVQVVDAGLLQVWHSPLWREAQAALPGYTLVGTVALDPGQAIASTMRLLSYLGIFYMAAQFGRDRARARQGLLAIVFAGLAYATYGIGAHFAGGDYILWFRKWAYLGDLTSTFVNRNAYGAYAGIGLVCCMGLVLNGLSGQHGRGRTYQVAEQFAVRVVPFLVIGLVLCTALLLSHSRAALGVTVLGLVVLGGAMALTAKVKRKTALFSFLALGLASLLVFVLAGDGMVERFAEHGVNDETRAELFRLTFLAIKDAPWTGHGYGSFPSVFPLYRDTSIPAPELFNQAHNIYLELMLELGVPATLLFCAALIWVGGVCCQGLVRRRRDYVYPAVALSVLTLLGAHGIVDFSAQMPAIAATLAFLLGLGFAQSFPADQTGSAKEQR